MTGLEPVPLGLKHGGIPRVSLQKAWKQAIFRITLVVFLDYRFNLNASAATKRSKASQPHKRTLCYQCHILGHSSDAILPGAPLC